MTNNRSNDIEENKELNELNKIQNNIEEFQVTK